METNFMKLNYKLKILKIENSRQKSMLFNFRTLKHACLRDTLFALRRSADPAATANIGRSYRPTATCLSRTNINDFRPITCS